MRQTGANQTTLQAGIFGNATTYADDISDPGVDLTSAFLGLQSGPVHLNVQFDEPLLPDDENDWLSGTNVRPFIATEENNDAELTITDRRGVIVVGHDRGDFTVDEVSKFAQEVGWPLIAEDPLSFPQSIAHASLFLASQKICQILCPAAVIVIGRTTLSRSTNTLVKSAGREIVIDPRIVTVDVRRSADQLFQTLPKITKSIAGDSDWISFWSSYGQRPQICWTCCRNGVRPTLLGIWPKFYLFTPRFLSPHQGRSAILRDLQHLAQALRLLLIAA